MFVPMFIPAEVWVAAYQLDREQGRRKADADEARDVAYAQVELENLKREGRGIH